MNTFTKRKLEKVVLKSIHGDTVQWVDGWGHSIPPHVTPALSVGETYYLEIYKFNDIGGIMKENGEYLFHRSDDYFILKRAEYLAEAKRKQELHYQNNFVSWTARTAALPDRYKARLERFLNDPDKGEEFRKTGMGWGYELIICELAELYEKHGFGAGTSFEGEPQAIRDFARKHGTIGNQHDVAKAWAKNPEVKI
jgi:hypothetical protein